MVVRTQMPTPEELAQMDRAMQHFEQLEAQFQQVRQQLTRAHRLATLGTIASMMAHEYNNILTPIISYAQMALDRPSDHTLLRKAVEKSLSGCERAARISSSLLGFARDSDEQPLAGLRETIDEAIACLARDPRRDGIELVIDVPDASLAIPTLNLQQVLLNLVLNAIQAMRNSGGQLRIVGRVDGSVVKIDVTDSGPGIPEEILDRLFEPFVTQLSGPMRDPEEPSGTGLGLCICRDLIQNAGGEITVESTPGQGAAFHLTLPKADHSFQTT